MAGSAHAHLVCERATPLRVCFHARRSRPREFHYLFGRESAGRWRMTPVSGSCRLLVELLLVCLSHQVVHLAMLVTFRGRHEIAGYGDALTLRA